MTPRSAALARLMTCGLLLSICPLASAQTAAPTEVPDDVRRAVASNPSNFMQVVVQRLYQISASGVATQEDIDRFERVEVARARAGLVGQMLPMDLDGDGNVSRAEFDAFMDAKPVNEKARAEMLRLEADTDKDGDTSFAEMMAYAGKKATDMVTAKRRRDRYNPMLFDENGDGRVDGDEISRRIEAIAKEPVSSTRSSSSESGLPVRRVVECNAPKPIAGSEIVLVSAVGSSGLSTVAVNGQETITSVVPVTIEDGDTPLYILAASSGAVIWKVDGATDRVVTFVAQPVVYDKGPFAGVGVVGLDPKRVAFVESRACFEAFPSDGDGKAKIAASMMSAKFGRKIDRIAAARDPNPLLVPSGRTTNKKPARSGPIVITGDKSYELTPEGPKLLVDDQGPKERPAGVDASTWSDFYREFPAGVIDIDRKSVVSPQPVESYEMLPNLAGIIKLMESGSVRRTRDRFYVIVKPFAKFPPMLGSDAKFILSNGIPMPAGQGKHSPVFLEETGECIGERGCPH